MADSGATPFTSSGRFRAIIAIVVVLAGAAAGGLVLFGPILGWI